MTLPPSAGSSGSMAMRLAPLSDRIQWADIGAILTGRPHASSAVTARAALEFACYCCGAMSIFSRTGEPAPFDSLTRRLSLFADRDELTRLLLRSVNESPLPAQI